LPEDWALYICAIWLVGVVIALSRVAVGMYRVYQVRKTCVPVAKSVLDDSLRATLEEFQSTRRVELCTSDLVRVPTAIGFLKPVVALPGWCVCDLSSSELHSIVLHELEHLRRYDDWTNLFQRIVGAVFFFHPAVWWLEGRLSLEREMACDDAVLAVVPDPKSYARCLVSLAEKSYLRRGIALAQAAVSKVQQLTLRVTQILSVRKSGATSVWKPALSIALVTICAGGASLDLAPRLIAFEQNSPVEGSGSRTTLAIARTHATFDQTAFDLKLTPARWITPAEPAKPAQKSVANRAPMGDISAANHVSKIADASRDASEPRELLAHRT
jgi:beta-lactamase regulating signal transducer with metallopeptidase domain